MKIKKVALIDVLDDCQFDITEIFKSVIESIGLDGDIIIRVNGLDDNPKLYPDVETVGVIISGSIHHVEEDSNKDWGISLFQFIREYYDKIPILGVCYGHQAIAYALGGKVKAHEQGRETGSVRVFLTSEAQHDELFSDFVDGSFVQETHLDHVVVLPENAVSLAYNHHSPIQAFRVGKSWGIQFHPELTPSLFKRLLGGRLKSLRFANELEEAKKLEEAIGEIKDCPMAINVLKRFIRHCMKEA